MNRNSECPSCKSQRLLGIVYCSETGGPPVFKISNPVSRVTLSDSPNVVCSSEDATACLDCGTILLKADPVALRKKAARWMRDEAERKSLGLE